MGFRLSPGAVDTHLREVLEQVPSGAAALLAARLSPVVESLIDAVITQAQEALKEENTCRKAQGLYLLRFPRLEHFIGSLDSLAPILEKNPPMLVKPYGTPGVLWCGGPEKEVDHEESNQPAVECPYRGEP